MTGWRTWIAAVAALVLTGGVVGPSLASAQQTDTQAQGPAATGVPADEVKAPNTGRVSLGLGADWASATAPIGSSSSHATANARRTRPTRRLVI